MLINNVVDRTFFKKLVIRQASKNLEASLQPFQAIHPQEAEFG